MTPPTTDANAVRPNSPKYGRGGVVLGCVLWLILLMIAGFVMMYSGLLVMAIDACGANMCPNEDLANVAVYVALFGAPATVVACFVAGPVVHWRGERFAMWPALGIVVVIAIAYAAIALADYAATP